jgi:hypothetical protein
LQCPWYDKPKNTCMVVGLTCPPQALATACNKAGVSNGSFKRR